MHREWKQQQMSVTHQVLLIAEQEDIWKQDLIFPVLLRELLILIEVDYASIPGPGYAGRLKIRLSSTGLPMVKW